MERLFLILLSALVVSFHSMPVQADENKLRVFTWEGYVSPQEVEAVNKLLADAGNPVRVEVIRPWAEGPDQMYSVIASKKADLSMLTLNYIQMQNERTAKLLQPINVQSPRLTNYKNVLDSLKNTPFGMRGNQPLYVPYGGGAYGIWANMKKVKKEDLPKSIKDLADPKWKGKVSLTKGQIQPNVALAMLAIGEKPFALHDLFVAGQAAKANELASPTSEAQKFLNILYGQVKTFWGSAPEFTDDLTLVASYGIEIAGLRNKGGDWQLVPFKEGNTVWLDTMNVMAHVSGKKLEAAEIFMNYYWTPEVQKRIVNELSMVGAIKGIPNPLLDENPNFFRQDMFWPPYHPDADRAMKSMSSRAMISATRK